jgi:hypothetical protein
MLRGLFRIIVILIVIGVLFFFFAPRFFNNAANSLLSSTNTAVAHAQGLAQYIPSNATTQGATSDLQVKLNDLLANANYDITLDQGQCGNVVKDLGTIKSDVGGNFDNVIPLSTLDLSKVWFIDVHLDNASGTSVVCGQLETNQSSGTQVITPATPKQNVFGSTTSQSSQGSSSTGTSPNLPNTGAKPGNSQDYDNNTYPRKY